MRKAVFVAAGLVIAGLLTACGEQKDSASNQASEADLHAVTGRLATMAANAKAGACFQQHRLVLQGYESKRAGVGLDQLLATLPSDAGAENVNLIKFGYKVSGPTDDVLSEKFMQCLESGAEEK